MNRVAETSIDVLCLAFHLVQYFSICSMYLLPKVSQGILCFAYTHNFQNLRVNKAGGISLSWRMKKLILWLDNKFKVAYMDRNFVMI